LKQRTRVLALLIALAIVTFLDRMCISVAGPQIQHDLHINSVHWGWILSAFVLAYGLFEIPSAALGDRTGHERVLTRIVSWWSAFTALTGLCQSFNQLLITRFLFGMGEAGAYPNIAGVIARWFAIAERGRAQGWVWAASRLGGALSPILVVSLIHLTGWRFTFLLFGVIGILWVIIWRLCYRSLGSPQYNSRIHEVRWNLILKNPQALLIFLAYASYAWGSWFFMSWFPTYLVQGAGFTETQMGIVSSLPFLFGIGGNLLGGLATDRLSIRYGLTIGRKLIICTSLTISAFLILAMSLTSKRDAIVVLSSLGFGIMDFMLPAAWALCLDIGAEYSGALSGVMNTGGQLGGVLCTVLVGYILHATGSYRAPLCTIAAMILLASLLFSRVDPTRTLTARKAHVYEPA
jgi:ACS family glucarate transporter-like MFS transporter